MPDRPKKLRPHADDVDAPHDTARDRASRADFPDLDRADIERRTWGPLAAASVAGVALLTGLIAALGSAHPLSWIVPAAVSLVAAAAVWVLLDRADRARRRDLARIGRLVDRLATPTTARAQDESAAAGSLASLIDRLDAREREIAERSQRQRAELDHIAAVINAVDTPVFSIDPEGRVLLTNAAAERLFTSRSGPTEGSPLDELFTRRELLELHGHAAEGDAARGTIRLLVDGATRSYEVSAVPRPRLSGESRHGVVLTLRDVTELAEAVRLKTDFAANASHELRTPIASIRAAVETMEGASDDPPMMDRLRMMIESHVSRLEEMVTDLLDLSRLESAEQPPQLEPVDVRAMVDRIELSAAPHLEEHDLVLQADLDPALDGIISDTHLLELVLRNLVDNAIKFARVGTPIRIIGRAVAPVGDDNDAEIEMLDARFEVIDQGVGIPLKQQQRIFERFFQVDDARGGGNRRRGSGLGLAIVKHALRRLGGRIEVESVWQHGTTMRFHIPACVRASDSDPASGTPLDDIATESGDRAV